jgi:hypothetical protein
LVDGCAKKADRYKHIRSELADIGEQLIDIFPPNKTSKSKYESFLEQLQLESEINKFHHLPS